jgi:hypothetical protein
VLAVGGCLVSALGVVAVLAHSFRVVIILKMRAGRDELSVFRNFFLSHFWSS